MFTSLLAKLPGDPQLEKTVVVKIETFKECLMKSRFRFSALIAVLCALTWTAGGQNNAQETQKQNDASGPCFLHNGVWICL